MEVIFLEQQAVPFSLKNSSVYKTKHSSIIMIKGIINAFDHMKFCLVVNLTIGGKPAVTWPPIVATGYVGFATTLNTQ